MSLITILFFPAQLYGLLVFNAFFRRHVCADDKYYKESERYDYTHRIGNYDSRMSLLDQIKALRSIHKICNAYGRHKSRRDCADPAQIFVGIVSNKVCSAAPQDYHSQSLVRP